MDDIVNIPVQSSKIFIWANSDLDGAASVVLLGNIFHNIEYKSAFFGKFEEYYKVWAKKHLEDFDKVFVVGMVLDQSMLNRLDDPRLVIISDRGENLKTFDSTLITDKCSSCCKLIYRKFKDKVEIPLDVKKLVAYVDDYNKYDLKYEESKYLNAIYRKMVYNKFVTFVNRFWNGYDGFTDNEIAIVQSYFDEIHKEAAELDLFKGEYRGWSVMATFSKHPVNEIAKELIDNHPFDVIMVVNPDTKFVSFRKPNDSKADIVYMAENLCGGGGGEQASGGQMTEKFMEYMRTLIEL